MSFVNYLDGLHFCPGHPDKHFIERNIKNRDSCSNYFEWWTIPKNY